MSECKHPGMCKDGRFLGNGICLCGCKEGCYPCKHEYRAAEWEEWLMQEDELCSVTPTKKVTSVFCIHCRTVTPLKND